jgi:hypothetical protein
VTGKAYAVPVARGLMHYVEGFFLNWKESDKPLPERTRLTLQNRVKAAARGGCCGHPGEPGC